MRVAIDAVAVMIEVSWDGDDVSVLAAKSRGVADKKKRRGKRTRSESERNLRQKGGRG